MLSNVDAASRFAHSRRQSDCGPVKRPGRWCVVSGRRLTSATLSTGRVSRRWSGTTDAVHTPRKDVRHMTRRRTIVTAAILAGALGLTACGTNRQESTGGSAGGGSSCDTSKGTLVIGMVAPLSGGLSALGLGMSHSADLAVDQANQKCTVPGYKLAFQAEDDQATPQVAGQAATKLASDPNVVGVVGTLNSSTSQTVQPILADRSIVQISPANTNPTLTLGEQTRPVAEAAVRELLPGRHHGPDPGPVRRPVPGAEGRQEEHRRDRRRQDLRRGPGRAVRPGGREARRERSSRARRSARRTPTSPA